MVFIIFPYSSAHSKNFSDVEVVDRTVRRSVGERARRTPQILQCPNLHGKNQGIAHFKAEVSFELFFSNVPGIMMYQGS